jgi:hypothetical protein
MTLTDLSILDSNGIGLWMKDCTHCKVSDCVIRDDRAEMKMTLSLKVEGGSDNWIKGSILANGADVTKDAALLEANH